MMKDLEYKAFHTKNPYGIGNAGKKIADFISKVKLDKESITKENDYKVQMKHKLKNKKILDYWC